ncbi:MAG TPA: PH domain-containing protein [Chthoniobacterales bacterium]|nr:PH domain-containing protein [Chthoniobacterales bacterium]
MQLYLYLNGAKRGPLSADRVQALLDEGVLQASDLACHQAGGEWKPVGTLTAAASQAVPAAAAQQSFSQPPESPREAIAQPTPLPPPPLPPALDSRPLTADALGPYSRSTLAPNETPFYKTSLHWIIFVRFGFLALIVFLFVGMPLAIAVQALSGSELGWFALPLAVLFLVPPTLAFASSELVITDRRVLIKTGIIRRQTLEMFISKIESVGVDQGFFGRMLNYGSVLVRGTGGFEQAFEAIAAPLEFRRWVQRLQTGDHAARA